MKLGVLGIGRLGLCLALNLNHRGFDVVGYDVCQSYIDALSSKQFNSLEPHVNSLLENNTIEFTTDISLISETDMVFIMVNTPSNPDGSFSHDQIDNVLMKIKDYKGFIVISSTVMPGYCDSLNNDKIIYNPQFIAQGSIIQDQIDPDFLLIGSMTDEGTNLIQSVYDKLCTFGAPYKVMNRLSAEITKLALNCYITTKISFANMLGDICNMVGADQLAVLSAIGTDTRVGKKCFSYGYGYGGPCFPRDNKAFINFANSHQIQPFICEATDKINCNHLDYQMKLIFKGILPKNITLDGKNAVVTDVSYKKNSEILEESQQLKLALEMTKHYDVLIKDSQNIISELKYKYGDLFSYEAL